MYRGFNLKFSLKANEGYYKIGSELYLDNLSQIEKGIESFLNPNGILNGNKIQNNWFPQIDSHIFLSHSHKDQKEAITLAGALYDMFSLKVFIDSTVWGQSDKLLKLIDDNYSLNQDKLTYSYEKRNISTCHVYLMLNSALSKMIDSCECIFFLNTPNSLSFDETVSKTISPWIFSEIAITNIIAKKAPVRNEILKSQTLSESLKVEYDLELSQLCDLTSQDFDKWFWSGSCVATKALDRLYENKPLNKNTK